MTSFGQYPLVYQLKQQGDGSFIPMGLAEASAFPSLSAVNLVVSSIKADVYVDIPAAFNFTGILTVTSIGAGTSIVDDSDPNNPKFRSILTPTDNFLTPGLNPGNNEVTIGWGTTPLSVVRGGTGADNVTLAQMNLELEPDVDIQVYHPNLNQLSNLTLTTNKILVGGPGSTLTDISAPTDNDTFLKYSGGSFIWTGVEPGGAASFPSEPGRIPYTVNTTTLGTADWLTIETGTGRFNVCEVYAVGPVYEGGVSLVNKYQACDVVLDSIASLNPVADQLIYFNGVNTATTAAITEQGRQLLDDTSFASMRTTLQLSSLATKSQVNLATGDVTNTLPIANGGTNKTSFTADQLIFSNDFSQDSTLTFNKTTKVLTTSSLSATNASANTIYEGGQSLISKYQIAGNYLTGVPDEYLTQSEADGIYQPCNVFLTTLASQGHVALDSADVCNTLPITKGGTNNTGSYGSDGIFYYDNSLQQFTNNSNVAIIGTGGSAYIKSPSVCATTVCATTIQEGGQTLTSKYLTQANAAVTYQPCDVFLETLSNQGWVNLNSADVCNTLPVTNGGTGLNTISDRQIVVGTGTNTIGTIAAPTADTYLRYNGANFAWSVIPTGTGTTLPSDACAVVFMNTIGDALTSNPAIRVNNIASTLEIFSDAAAGTGGLDLLPGSLTEGNVRWDPDYHSLSIEGENETRITLGVDDIIPVLNQTGSTIRKGQVAYVSGSSGGTYRGTISLLSDTTPDPFTLGVCLKDIANGANGYLLKKGLIKNAAISDVVKTGVSLTEGDTLYVSDQAGKITNVAPGAGKHAATIGIFLASGGANISYGVTVDQGYDLADLHDVNANPTSDGETLVWNTAGYYNAGTINDITGTLTVAKGGTGKTSFTANQLIYGANFAQDSNLYYSNNVLYASAASATTNVSAGGSEYGGNATVAGYVLATGNIATFAGTVAGANVCGTNLFQNGVNIDEIYQPIGNYQPNNTRLHELTAVSIDGLLRFNGSNYVTQPTSTYETTANANATYLTKATYNAFTGTLQDLAYLDSVNLTGTEVVGTLPVTKGGTGLTTLTANSFLVGNGTSISLIPTATYETTANANATYLTKTTYNAFTGTLQDLAYLDQVNLTTTSVTGTLPILNGGTGKTSFIANRLIYGDAFDQDPNLTFDGTVLKSPTVCGTTVCGTTILEAGQSLTSKYLTQANAATTYQPTNAKLHQVTAVTTEGLLYFNGTSYTSQVTSTYATPGYVTTQLESYTPLSITGQFETTANAQATYLGKSAFNSWSGALALSAGLLDVQIATLSTGQVLKWNGLKWANANDATGTGSTGGSPGGSTTHVQVNYYNGESNVFSGNAGLTYDLTTSTLRAQNWSNLPSGSAYWNANQLSGYPIVSSLDGPGPEPVNGNTLMYLDTGVPTPGWYYVVPGGGSPGGSTTQIQFNNTGSFSGSPALTWDNSTSTLVSKQLSATTYLNLPSGTATWNANKIQGIPVDITSDTVYDILISNGGNTGYVNSNLLTLAGNAAAGWNAAKIQGTFVSSTPPTRNNQLLAYNTSVSQWTAGLAVSSGSGAPTGGVDGDIYIQYFDTVDVPTNASALRGFTVSSTTPTNNQVLTYVSAASAWNPQPLPAEIGIACSDETTNLTSGTTAKATFRMPYAMTLTSVRANVNTAPVGSTILVDVNKNGSTIFSTRVSIDASEKTSVTAATPFVLSTTSLADDDEITVDIDQVGSSTPGKGLKIWLIGTRA